MIINDKRALAYTQRIAWIKPIEGADNIEEVGVLGWHLIAKKGEFKEGDLCVYFEIDSKLPEADWSEFMTSKHYKVKTMKLGKFGVISQGLALPINAFEGIKLPTEENIDVTDLLGVKYSIEEDNKRKNNIDKYKRMVQRHNKLFKNNKLIKWLYARDWGKKILFIFLGKKKDKKAAFWPEWVSKTDEERAQNLPFLFPGDETKWIVTEKIDGSSTTFTMKRGLRKNEFYVCSRNVCFDKPEKEDKLFYETNIYTEMAEKYNIEAVLKNMLDMHKDWETVTIQGETYGKNVQKRDYGLDGHDFMAFNLIYTTKDNKIRYNSMEMTYILQTYQIPCVPILDIDFILPETVEDMINYANGKSEIDGDYREGVVLRTLDGKQSFKAVSNVYLLQKGE